MKSSRAREEKSRKKMVLSGAIIILATLCISFNSFPMTAEGADEAQDDQPRKGLAVSSELELTSIKQALSDLTLVHVKIAYAYADHQNFKEAVPWVNRVVRLKVRLRGLGYPQLPFNPDAEGRL